MTDTLLHWSGGLDSTLCLYQMLSSGKVPLVHHVELRTQKARNVRESEAIQNVTEWLTAQGLPQFRLLESEFCWGDLGEPSPDMEVLAMFTGRLLRSHKSIKKIVTPTILEEAFAADPGYIGNRARNSIILAMARRHDFELTRPILNFSKAQVIDALPPELAALTWYCRYPTEELEACHACRTCKQVDAGLRELGRGPLR